MFVFGNAGRLGWIARSFHKFLKINSSELRGWSEPARRRAVLKGSAWTARREKGTKERGAKKHTMETTVDARIPTDFLQKFPCKDLT